MFKRFILAAILCLSASAAWAQNPTCPTRPAGDSSNACASTAFVSTAVTNGNPIFGVNPAFAVVGTTFGGVWSMGDCGADNDNFWITRGSANCVGGQRILVVNRIDRAAAFGNLSLSLVNPSAFENYGALNVIIDGSLRYDPVHIYTQTAQTVAEATTFITEHFSGNPAGPVGTFGPPQPIVVTRGARGDINNPLHTRNGDFIGIYDMRGAWDTGGGSPVGTVTDTSAGVAGNATCDWDSGVTNGWCSRQTFYTTPIGAISPVARMYIQSSGGVAIGFDNDPGNGSLFVANSILVGNGGVDTTPTVVASLGTCNVGAKGSRKYVSDATASTFYSIVAGGGSIGTSVGCNGANWVVGG